MTEKRFKHKRNQLGMQFICYDDKTELLGTFADADGVNNIVTLLNDLSEENEQLAKEKERYKRLSEIRREEINNRILTIKEFIENCSDNKVKKILEDLFYSEVKEYDLSAQNRKLLHENEKLKSENEDMRRLINNISLQRDEFHRGARENANSIGKLKKENEQLKQQLKELQE